MGSFPFSNSLVITTNQGESLTTRETKEMFKEILYQKDPYYGNFPSNFTSKEFIEDVLGMGDGNDELNE